MTWKKLALFPFNIPHLNCNLMHFSDLTLNPGYLSPVKRYHCFKTIPPNCPIENVWGQLIHAHGLWSFDVPKI